jgi:hypothetical protein
MTKNNITTIEGLAALINETMASKEDIKEFRAEVNQKFELVESRLDRIEHLLLEEQKRKMGLFAQRPKKVHFMGYMVFNYLIDRRSREYMTRHTGCLPSQSTARLRRLWSRIRWVSKHCEYEQIQASAIIPTVSIQVAPA